MFRLTALALSLLVSAAVIGTPAEAAPLAISFEALPGADGVLGTSDDLPVTSDFGLLGNEYASVGLTFTQGTLFRGGFFDGNPDNHFISSTNPIGVFSVPVFGISISSKSFWNATLTAYDAADNVLASVTAVNPSAGWDMFSATFGLTTSEAIHHFTIADGSDALHILNLDNLVLDTGSTDVPEPSQQALFGLGMLALLQRVGRNKRR